MGTRKRLDIQGLRAIAVVLVVLTHLPLQIHLPAGFVGVDIFFVISGYVIGFGYLNSSQAGIHFKGFSPRIFLSKRVNRLLLPLTAMLLFVLTISFIFGPILNFKTTGLSALSSEFFTSNFYYLYKFDSYWNPELRLNPLLHTWSLSTEFQTYLLFAAMFIVLSRWQLTKITRNYLLITSLLSSASLIWFLYLLANRDKFILSVPFEGIAFYTPPSRFWEFGIGLIVAAIPARVFRSQRNLKTISTLMSILFICSVLLANIQGKIDTSIILICSLTGLIIWLGKNNHSLNTINSFLTKPPLVWIGDRSYSIYLYHWPLLVLAVWLFGANILGALLAIAISFVIANYSYKIIETRPNLNIKLLDRSFRFKVLVPFFALFGALSILAISALPLSNGIPAKDFETKFNAGTISAKELNEVTKDCVYLPRSVECKFFGQDAQTIVVMGDSLGWRLIPVVAYSAKQNGFNIIEIMEGGYCGIWLSKCTKLTTQILEETNIAGIIIATNFDFPSSLLNGSEVADGRTPICGNVTASKCEIHLRQVSDFYSESTKGLEELRKINPKILVSFPFPQQQRLINDCLHPSIFQQITNQHQVTNECKGTSTEWQKSRQGAVIDAFEELKINYPDINFWNPIEFLCKKDFCPTVINNGEILMDDAIHWKPEASRFFFEPINDFVRSLSSSNK